MKDYHSKSFDLITDGDYTRYEYHHGEVTDYLTADEILFQILAFGSLSPFLDDGRIRLNDSHDNAKYRISDLAFACYNGYIKSFETWKSDMQVFLDWKHSEGFEIDHADSNPHNNTAFNLSLMDDNLNREKSSIVARFKLPMIVKTAYIENEYRVQAVWTGYYAIVNLGNTQVKGGGGYFTLNFICSDANGFVDCLKTLSVIDTSWSYPAKENGKWRDTDRECWSSDIHNSLSAQKQLTAMSCDDFDIYPEGGLCLAD